MARFRKGTMDHDNDGRKGGSMKGDDMAKKRKANTDPVEEAAKVPEPKKAVTTPGDEAPEAKATLPERKAAAEELFAKADEAAAAEAAENRLSLAVRGF